MTARCLFCNRRMEPKDKAENVCWNCSEDSTKVDNDFKREVKRAFMEKKRRCITCNKLLDDPRFYFRHPICHRKKHKWLKGAILDTSSINAKADGNGAF